MLSSMIEDNPFQKVSRKFSQIQLEPQTRSSFNGPNSGSRSSGTIDMTFNRQSLDWSRLQLLAPHSTRSNQQVDIKETEPRSTKDLYDLLQDWNFPSQPTVPPRLVVWGPYNKSDSHRPPLEAIASSTHHSPTSQSSFPQTPPPYRYKTPKRRREGHLPPSRPHVITPVAFTKRPRTRAETPREFPVSPGYTKHDISNYSSPMMNSLNQEGSAFFNDYSMDHTPYSPKYPNYHQQSPSVYSRNPIHQDHFPDPYHSHSFNSPISCLATPYNHNPPNYLNKFYLPSPISPTTPFPPTLQSPSHSQSPCAIRHRQPYPKNSYHSNVWSREWHQTFHQFRNESGTY